MAKSLDVGADLTGRIELLGSSCIPHLHRLQCLLVLGDMLQTPAGAVRSAIWALLPAFVARLLPHFPPGDPSVGLCCCHVLASFHLYGAPDEVVHLLGLVIPAGPDLESLACLVRQGEVGEGDCLLSTYRRILERDLETARQGPEGQPSTSASESIRTLSGNRRITEPRTLETGCNLLAWEFVDLLCARLWEVGDFQPLSWALEVLASLSLPPAPALAEELCPSRCFLRSIARRFQDSLHPLGIPTFSISIPLSPSHSPSWTAATHTSLFSEISRYLLAAYQWKGPAVKGVRQSPCQWGSALFRDSAFSEV